MQNIISYFGGKNKIADKILSYFPAISEYDIYLEPFGGSAGVLLNKEISKCEIYNDIDKNVYSLYKVLSDKDLRLLLEEKIKFSLYHEDLRLEYKELLKLNDLSLLDRAYYFWYVSRTSRNGNVNSSFRVDTEIKCNQCRSTYEFNNSINSINDIHHRLKNVVFHNRCALELIEKYRKNPKAFIYLDPPYHPSTRTRERYNYDFSLEQHNKLLELLVDKENKCKIILSGYYHSDYDLLKENGFNNDSFNIYLKYGKKTEANLVTENVWFNYTQSQISLFSI